MRVQSFVALFAVLSMPQAVVADDDIILPPINKDTSLPERLLVFIPGGLVPNEHYRLTAQAIQNATVGLRLTVVIPWVFQKLCIITCPLTSMCGILKNRIDAAVAKSDFKSTNPKEDTFITGHSLGATCTNQLVQFMKYQYAGIMEFGGYVDMTGNSSIANYTIPLLHMAGELDGGGARPSTMAGLFEQSQQYAKSHSLEESLKVKPVHVLEGMDHSDFCPGFFVTKTKDCKTEVSQDVAMATIGKVAGAFLHLNSPTSDALKATAMATMKTQLVFTESMVKPYFTAYQLEKEQLSAPPSGVPAGPWCSVAANKIAGLSAGDAGKLKVEPCELVTAGLHEFEHQHTNYSMLPNGQLDVTCYTDVEPPASSIDATQFAPKSVDCKMVDATRVAEQLQVTTNTNVSCADINRMAVEVAKKLVPAKSLERFEKKGRGICFMPDTTVFGNIGPLWLMSSVKRNETTECLQVSSSKLISTVESKIFPGNHYCKLLAPSAVMDWIMTDSHKPFPYPSSASDVEGSQFEIQV